MRNCKHAYALDATISPKRKRQSTAALQDAGAPSPTPVCPLGPGVRLSSAALDFAIRELCGSPPAKYMALVPNF